jgi:hypothetical protein
VPLLGRQHSYEIVLLPETDETYRVDGWHWIKLNECGIVDTNVKVVLTCQKWEIPDNTYDLSNGLPQHNSNLIWLHWSRLCARRNNMVTLQVGIPDCRSTDRHVCLECALYVTCKTWGFRVGDYEECCLLGYKNPVRTFRKHITSPLQSLAG